MLDFWNSILERLLEIFDPNQLGVQFADFMANVIVAGIVLLAYLILWLIVKVAIGPVLRRSRMDRTTVSFLETVAKWTILGVGLITALDSAGVRTSALLASLGIVGLTIGFAARDALSNLISGLLIYLDRPFVIGDLVEVEGYYGRVTKITLRSTRVVTRDGKMLAVPNSEVINKTVTSYTNFPHLRLDIAVTVAVDENLERVRGILLDLVHGDPDYLEQPAPRVVVTALNDYNVALELQVWIREERRHVEKRFELREKVFDALTRAEVDMPFETFRITPLESIQYK